MVGVRLVFLVFSAYAEVVPRKLLTSRYGRSILRVRGGSSASDYAALVAAVYSPRTRR